MILLAIITFIFGAFKLLLLVVPDVPQMPAAITDPLNFVAGMVGSGVGIVQYILTPPIFIALSVVAVGLFTFDFFWAVFWWILPKIPVIGVHVRKN